MYLQFATSDSSHTRFILKLKVHCWPKSDQSDTHIYPPAPLGATRLRGRGIIISQSVNIVISPFNIVNIVLGVLVMSIQCYIIVSSKLPDWLIVHPRCRDLPPPGELPQLRVLLKILSKTNLQTRCHTDVQVEPKTLQTDPKFMKNGAPQTSRSRF